MTTRVAFVWTPEGLETFKVGDAWPRSIVFHEWIYEHGINADGSPCLMRGSRTGAEMLNYDIRRRVTCTEGAALLEPGTPDGQEGATSGEHAGAHRSARAGDARPSGNLWTAVDPGQLSAARPRPPVPKR